MLIRLLKRMKVCSKKGAKLKVSDSLRFFLTQDFTAKDFKSNRDELLKHFAALDDYDIITAAKVARSHEDRILAFLADSIINRKLFKLRLKNEKFEKEYVQYVRKKVMKKMNFKEREVDYLVFQGKESNNAYSTAKDEIKILHKSGEVRPMSESSDFLLPSKNVTKCYLCHPKGVL